HVTNSRNTSIVSSFESQLDDFFEYSKKAQTSQPDSLQEVKQYLDETILATSVASKQMFSCASHIIDDTYTSLDP
ncbi:26591_t:CDS:2, partial [Gigaspora margarita]